MHSALSGFRRYGFLFLWLDAGDWTAGTNCVGLLTLRPDFVLVGNGVFSLSFSPSSSSSSGPVMSSDSPSVLVSSLSTSLSSRFLLPPRPPPRPRPRPLPIPRPRPLIAKSGLDNSPGVPLAPAKLPDRLPFPSRPLPGGRPRLGSDGGGRGILSLVLSPLRRSSLTASKPAGEPRPTAFALRRRRISSVEAENFGLDARVPFALVSVCMESMGVGVCEAAEAPTDCPGSGDDKETMSGLLTWSRSDISVGNVILGCKRQQLHVYEKLFARRSRTTLPGDGDGTGWLSGWSFGRTWRVKRA